MIKIEASSDEEVEKRKTQDNCHQAVVKQARKNEILTADLLFCKKTKLPKEQKRIELINGAKIYGLILRFKYLAYYVSYLIDIRTRVFDDFFGDLYWDSVFSSKSDCLIPKSKN